MDGSGKIWYYPCMRSRPSIPIFNLFGETGAFPDIVHCERIRDRALQHDWRISPHRHSDMVQILQMERGSAQVSVDGRDHALTDGEFVYLPAQSVHGFAFRQGAEGVVISFPLTLLAALPQAAGLQRRLAEPFVGAVDAPLGRLIAALVEGFSQSGTFRAPLLAVLGPSLLVAVAETASRADAAREPPHQRRFGDFARLLHQHLTVDWGAREFAAALGLTTGHLNRICQTATGQSVGTYIEAARMTEASRLLAFTQLSIAEVGYRLGYDDPPYFSRRFRRLLGQTPSSYRARFHG